MSYIGQLEYELIRAGRVRQERRLGLRPSDLLLAAAGVGALLVAVLALALLRHSASSPPATSGAVPADARGLVSQLAVLRRPQTAADRGFGSAATLGALEIGLTRLAIDTGDLKVWIVVQRPGSLGPHALWPARQGAEAGLVAEVDGRRYRTLPVPASALRDPSVSINAGGWLVELVPDGVAQTRWSIPVKTGTFTATGRVVSNVAFTHLKAAAAPLGPRARWYDAEGHPVVTTPKEVLKRAMARTAAMQLEDRRTAAAQRYPVPASLVRAFPALSAGGTAASGVIVNRPGVAALPDGVLKMAMGNPTHVDPGSILAVVAKDGLRFWVEPGEHGVCLTAQSGANGFEGTCAPDLKSVLRAGVWSTFPAPGGTSMLVGVVPGTPRTVRVDLTGGGTRTVPVIDGLVITPAAGTTGGHRTS